MNTRTGYGGFGKVSGGPTLLRAVFTIMKPDVTESSGRKPNSSPPLDTYNLYYSVKRASVHYFNISYDSYKYVYVYSANGGMKGREREFSIGIEGALC